MPLLPNHVSHSSAASLAVVLASTLPCVASAARVLLVTGAATISSTETARKTQFESWGHTVTTIEDAAAQASFDAALASADVVYIPMTIQEWELSTKVKSTTKGVVCEERYLDTQMGFSSASGWNANHVDTQILSNSHEVTAGLSTGYVTIVTSSTELALMNPTVATGMTILSKQNYSAGSMLGVIEAGGALAGGGVAAGRRVRMPWGGDNFSWSLLNASGLQIARQAISWAAASRQLVLHWKLDETSGTTAADASTNANTGTYVGSPTLGAPAPRCYGATFSSDGQRVTAAASASLDALGAGNADFSAAFWVRPGAPVGAGVYRSLLQKGSAGSARMPGLWLNPTANTVHFRLSTTASTNEGSNSSAELPKGVWSHVAVVKQGSSYKLFINGKLDTTLALAGTSIGSSYPVYVGDTPWESPTGGQMDDVRIWNYALTNAEIAEVYGLVGWWKLDETSGATAADSSLSGANATLTGTQTWTYGQEGGGFQCKYSDGIDDYFTAANSNGLDRAQEGSYTVMAYFKPNSVPPGSGSANTAAYALVVKTGWHLGLQYNANQQFQLDHWTTGYNWNGVGTWSNAYPPGRFYHVAGVVDRDAGSVRVYVDGSLVNTATYAAGTAAPDYGTNPWRIGVAGPGYSTYRWAADGVLDDVRVYNRALLAEEIAPFTIGLVGHWAMDEGAGTTVADSSARANNAAFKTGSPQWIDGVRGKALAFDGTNDIATGAKFDPPKSGAVAFWFRSDGPLTDQQRPFGVNGDWEARFETTGILQLDLGASPFAGNEPFGTGSAIVDFQRWRHIVAQFDADLDTYEVHLDGKLLASGVNSVNMVKQTADFLSIGSRTGSTQRFRGAIDDFRVYNRRLSASEIAEIYGLVGWWKLQEQSGSTVADSSGVGGPGAVAGVTLGRPGPDPATLPYAGQFAPGSVLDTAGLPAPVQNIRDGLSVASWVYVDGHQDYWYLQSWEEDDFDAYRFAIGDDGQLKLTLNQGTALTGATGSFSGSSNRFVTKGTWVHVAATFDGANVRFYFNGVLDSVQPASGVRIGRGATGLFFGIPTDINTGGRMADIRLYNRAITPGEVRQLYSGKWNPGLRITKWFETANP